MRNKVDSLPAGEKDFRELVKALKEMTWILRKTGSPMMKSMPAFLTRMKMPR
ncbi:hypothetical protein EMPG_17082 [Blastomyces silverae]|uniref:Uncharacterized protein n=1 Tax=Blastomyces silverae TaxID=2060906 RepID=A0A0H1B7N0_9EURO|nr:hypothetical protein EMPG_17082 [Blastomyces silverae]